MARAVKRPKPKVAAKKAATKKAVAKKAAAKKVVVKKAGPARRPTTAGFRARVRMYRQGLGDCFLVTLARKNAAPYRILIDCGVFLGTERQKEKMAEVVADVARECAGKLDLLIATHEHWDHLSGFIQAADAFETIEIAETWLGWTENPADPQAKRLGVQRHQMVAALRAAATGMRARAGALGASGEGIRTRAGEIDGLLDFFGAAGSTKDALEKVRKMAPKRRYCRPSEDPVEIEGAGARLYVLGPPEDEKLLKRHTPSKREPETYGMVAFDQYLSAMAPAFSDGGASSPFAPHYAIPTASARGMGFFDRRYFAEASDDADGRQGWRRIDGTWLDLPAEMALKLDAATNNTSLVLAIELGDGDVLLFAGDAQVGNWLSWQDLEWDVDRRKVTGPDLLRRTVLYKVGHHGSHNATLREKGVEMMEKLAWAMIPVNEDFARDVKHWNAMPLDDIVTRLRAVTKENGGAVLRADARSPPGFDGIVETTPLYHQLTL